MLITLPSPGAYRSTELEKLGVRLKAASSLLKIQNSSSALYRRGSRPLSDGVGDSIQVKNSEEAKKADHMRKKLRAQHEEARTVLAKKLQVENAR